jgi:putative mycofactocin binding protein MftB
LPARGFASLYTARAGRPAQELMNAYRVFRLNKGVQVRREQFGLLFYNSRGPRLYFVPTGDLVEDHFFTGSQHLGELVDTICDRIRLPRHAIEERVGRIMHQLESRGLINGQSLC